MNINDMKNILAKKLKEENTYFTKSHIGIKKQGESYKIVIKDYEHIYFKMKIYWDEFFGYGAYIYDSFDKHNVMSAMDEHNKDKAIENALIQLGYHIGNTF